jgi:hypothetical protein
LSIGIIAAEVRVVIPRVIDCRQPSAAAKACAPKDGLF